MKRTDRTIRLANDADRPRWDAVVSHPMQSWAWGDFRASCGITVVRTAIVEGPSLINGWQCTFHPIPYLPFTVGYFPKGGPITAEMIRELTKIGKEHHAIYLQIEPNATAGSAMHRTDALVPSHHPLFTKHTFVLDLTKGEDELLGNMHPKTRYNIRVAQRHGVTVQEDNSDGAFAAYLALSEETTARQGFYAHDRLYHERMWRIMHASGVAHLWTAVYEKKILAAWIIFRWKHNLYYPYGASARTHRDVMAPNLLLWELMRWGKRNGYSSLDLWGALGKDPDQNDPWYGFHRFKQGYNPEFVEFVGSFDLIINRPAYRAFTLTNSLRWRFLKKGR